MGCDIHLHTEVKIDGVWYTYGTPQISRNYDLFAKMADVRNYNRENPIVPISKPKGLPEDCSVITKFESNRWGIDGHSHSYLTAKEIVELEQWWKVRFIGMDWASNLKWPEQQWGYLCGNGWGDWVKYPEERPEGIEDIRFVFWFDN